MNVRCSPLGLNAQLTAHQYISQTFSATKPVYSLFPRFPCSHHVSGFRKMNSPDAFLYPSSLSDPVKGHCLRQTSCSRQRLLIQIPRLLFIRLFLLQGLCTCFGSIFLALSRNSSFYRLTPLPTRWHSYITCFTFFQGTSVSEIILTLWPTCVLSALPYVNTDSKCGTSSVSQGWPPSP